MSAEAATPPRPETAAAPRDPWADAVTALSLLAVDPAGLGGMWLRARSGPVRDRLLAALPALPLPLRRFAPTIADDQLYGGLDLAATLAAGHLRQGRGLLAEPAALLLTMAERTGPGLAARLAAALDAGAGHCLIAADEGAEPDEALPRALTDRLAFHLDLETVGLQATAPVAPDAAALAAARARLPSVRLPEGAAAELVILAARLGIAGPRAVLLAMAAARAAAALAGRETAGPEDLGLAVALVYAPRATIHPDAAPADDPPPPAPPETPEPPADTTESEDSTEATPQLPAELLLEAVRAALPPDLLARLATLKARTGRGAAGSGAVRKGNRRGRPIPSRPGRLEHGCRLDLVATLRAAAPWQTIRRRAASIERPLYIRGSDLRIRRYEEKSDRLLVFAVDASGSAALARLAEAKGAVELLLAEAYARRDHVALVSFRGETAETLLPPTRSLVQTKRRLSALPGGGGTPLAAGLQAAIAMAEQGRARGMTPTICLLTDGRANIALDGTADRARAAEDAARVARAARAAGQEALVIDMSKRPQRALEEFAATLGAAYVPMPRADAGRLSTAVSAALEG